MISIQASGISAKEAIGLSLVSLGFLSAMLGVLLNLKTTIEAARRSTARVRHPLQHLRESLNSDRVFMEHKKVFPGSRRRIVVDVFFIGGLVCFFIGTRLLTTQ